VPFEEVLDLLQNRLVIDFGYDDDAVIASLTKCMQQLRADHRLFPAPNLDATANEQPRTPFGEHVMQRTVDDIRRTEIRIQSRHTSRAQSMSNYATHSSSTPTKQRQGEFAQSVTRRLAKVTPASTSRVPASERWSPVRKNSLYDNVDERP